MNHEVYIFEVYSTHGYGRICWILDGIYVCLMDLGWVLDGSGIVFGWLRRHFDGFGCMFGKFLGESLIVLGKSLAGCLMDA